MEKQINEYIRTPMKEEVTSLWAHLNPLTAVKFGLMAVLKI